MGRKVIPFRSTFLLSVVNPITRKFTVGVAFNWRHVLAEQVVNFVHVSLVMHTIVIMAAHR